MVRILTKPVCRMARPGTVSTFVLRIEEGAGLDLEVSSCVEVRGFAVALNGADGPVKLDQEQATLVIKVPADAPMA